MFPNVCHCCGGQIAPSDQGRRVHICKDCERLIEDDSPSVTALALQALVVEDDKSDAPATAVEKPASKPPDPLHLEEPAAKPSP
jgi:hypothetical protein